MRERDQQTNLLLVEEVKKHDILYNFHLPDYSKKHETEKAWNEVGNVVKLTANECKERWKNIRAVFVRHMKLGGLGKEKKAYYLSDALQFTVPYIKVLGKLSGNQSMPPVKEEEEFFVKDESIIVDDDEILSETPLPSPFPVPPPRSSSSSSSSTAAFLQHQDHQPIKHHLKKKKRAKNYVDNAFIEYFNHKTSSPREEALKMFLLSMLPDLMEMDDREVRQFKRKTLETVDEILSAKSTLY